METITSKDLDRYAEVHEDEYVSVNLREELGNLERDFEYGDPNKIILLAEKIISKSEDGKRPIKLELRGPTEWNRWAINEDYRAILNGALSDRGYVLKSIENLTEDRGCDELLCFLDRVDEKKPVEIDVNELGYAHHFFN
jgi:hypothetical protein